MENLGRLLYNLVSRMENKEIFEYTVPTLNTRDFRYIATKDKRGHTLPKGICPVCNQHRNLAKYKNFPTMCYDCYQKVKIYRTLTFDVLHLQKKEKLDLKQAIRIVEYVTKYLKTKRVAALLIVYNYVTGSFKFKK